MVTYRVKRTRRKLNFFEYTLFYRYDFGTTKLQNKINFKKRILPN